MVKGFSDTYSSKFVVQKSVYGVYCIEMELCTVPVELRCTTPVQKCHDLRMHVHLNLSLQEEMLPIFTEKQ